MLHVLFTVLKIILIVLAVIVGLVLLIAAAVLFVPVRYSAFVEKDGGVTADARVSWLLHMVSVPIGYDGGGLHARIKIFGFTVKRLFGEEPSVGNGATGENEAAADEKPHEMPSEKPHEDEKPPEEKRGTKDEKPPDAVSGGEDDGQTEGKMGDTSSKKDKKRKKDRDTEDRKSKDASAGKKKKKSKGKDKKDMSGIADRVSGIKSLLTDERTAAALKLALLQAGYLLKKLAPKKVCGKIHFGMEDPSKTGELLAGLGAVYPLTGGALEVSPDFEEKIFEGSVFLKGYIQLYVIALIALRLIRDRNIRFVYKKIAG